MNPGKRDGQIHPTTKPRLGPEQVELLLAAALRIPEVFTLAREQLKPELFNAATEPHYYALWQAALQVAAENTPLALFETVEYAYTVVELKILNNIRAEPELVNPEYQERIFSRDPNVPGLLYWIYQQTDPKSLSFNLGRDLLRDFRLEREVQDPIRKALLNTGDGVVTNLPAFLQEVHQRQLAIETINDDPVGLGAPEGYFPRPLAKFETGIPFLNKFLGGGHARQEIYGVLGTFGSGKTSLAVMIAGKGALVQQEMAAEAAKQGVEYLPKIWYLFSYEATYDEMLVRLWSQECTIEHERLEEKSFEELTTIANGEESLLAYEKAFFAKQSQKSGLQLQGERERLEAFRKQANLNLGLVDMTGSGKFPGLGNGYVSEIAGIIARNMQRRCATDGKAYQVGGVVIDYAGLCAYRHLTSKGMRTEDLRHLIGRFGYECKRQIAIPYDCPVWVFHQLSSEANKRTHASSQHYADAAEARNFAENMAFAMTLGTKDMTFGGAFKLEISKARRSDLKPPIALRIDGPFYRIIPAPDVLIGSDGRFVKKEDADKVVEVPGVGPSESPPTTGWDPNAFC